MKTNQSGSDNWEDLLTTKLRIPALNPDCYHRERLVKGLQTCMNQVVLLVAPTGYGKTTLLVEWLSGKRSKNQHVMWITLDSLDNTPIQFWSYILLGFQQEIPGFKFHRQHFLSYGLQPENLHLLNPLLNEMSTIKNPVYLVLDDYQVIQDETVHHSLEYLINHQPPNLHIIIASRVLPPLRLSRKKALRHVVEFNSQDLSFTYPETTAYLSSVMGLQTNLDKVEQLYQATKGWIAGIQLAALSLRTKNTQEFHWNDFPDNLNDVKEYLVEEVIGQQDTEICNFLVQTSILSEFCPELCNAVTGLTDSMEMLQKIEQANLFITAIDRDRQWYRYHPLFANALQVYLKEKTPDEIPELHRRAYTWLRENGFSYQAISYALAAGDVHIVADILERSALNAIINNDLITLANWTQRFTPSLLYQHPHLGVYDALAHFFLGQGQLVDEKLKLLGKIIDDNQMSHISPETISRIRWEMSAIQAVIDRRSCSPNEIIPRIQALIQSAPREDNYFSGFLANAMAITYDENDDLAAAIAAFHQSHEFARLNDLPNPLVHSQCEIARMHRKQGRLSDAEQAYQHALEYTLPNKAHFGSRILALTGLMGIASERYDLEKARYFEDEVFSQFDQLEGALGPLNYHLTVLLQLADYKMVQGDFLTGNYFFQRAAQDIQQHSTFLSHDLLNEYIDVQVNVWLASNEISQGEQELKKRIGYLKGYGNPAIAESVGLARVYLAQGKCEEVIHLLKQLYPGIHQKGMCERQIEINLLLAVAFWKKGEKEQAYHEIHQAVELAEPEKFIRIFINEGEDMKEMLQNFIPVLQKMQDDAERHEKIQYLKHIISSFTNIKISVATTTEVKNMIATESSLCEPLSLRESEVLTLLLGGKAAKEIAISLSITPNTVRAHIQSIHRKMNVHSRMEIYQKARELNLIR